MQGRVSRFPQCQPCRPFPHCSGDSFPRYPYHTSSPINHATVIEILPGDDHTEMSKRGSSTTKMSKRGSSTTVHRTEGRHYSVDLEQGRRIPQAAGLSWQDPFFIGESEDLVAVFDHDYIAMYRYRMKVVMLTRIVPIFLPAFVLVVASMILAGPSTMCDDDTDPYCEEEVSGSDLAYFD